QNDAGNVGGGIYIFRVTTHLYNMTFGGNGADADLGNIGAAGGGLYVDDSSTVILANSVLQNVNDSTHAGDDCTTVSSTLAFQGINQVSTLAGCAYTGLA